MRVLLLNQVFYPDTAATAQHTTDLARFLRANGCEVTVVTGRRGYEDRQKIYAARENYQGIEIFRVHSTGFGKLSFFRRFVDAITLECLLVLRLLTLRRQDVILCFTSPPLIGFLGVLFKFFKGGRVVQWLMDINPHIAIAVGYLNKESLTSRFLLWVFRFTAKRSDQIVVLDRWMKERMISEGVKAEKIVVVPPWPVHKPVEAKPKLTGENPFRVAYGLQGKFVILYSGNHSIVHPLKTLLDCAVEIRDRDDIKFVFIGTGLRMREVTECREKEGLTNILQLPYQPREALEHSLAMADLHVAIMGNDVSGLVHASKIYGILATGKPYVSIAPEKSHLVDLLQACPYGFHVEHGDVNGLIGVIERTRALTQEQKEEFRERNSSYVRTQYGPELSLGHFFREVILHGQGFGSSPEFQLQGQSLPMERTDKRGGKSV